MILSDIIGQVGYENLVVAFSDVWSQQEVDERLEEALNHKAAKKYTNLYLYCRNWLRRDAQVLRDRRRKPEHQSFKQRYLSGPLGRLFS